MKKSKKILLGALSTASIIIGIGASVFRTSSSANISQNQVQIVDKEITRKNAHLAESGIYYDTSFI